MIFRKKPLMLSLLVYGYWMLMALISALPFIGRIGVMLLIPVFSVSLMNTCRLIEQGGPLPAQLLFSGFQKNLRPLLVLGVIYSIVSLCIFGIVSMVDDGVLFRLVFLSQVPSSQDLLSAEVNLASQLALGLFAPLMMAYWYAPILVAWHDLSAGKSLFFSIVACARNWRAFLVYGATFMIFTVLLTGLLSGLLNSMNPGGSDDLFTILLKTIIFVLLPALYASFYVSYRDVFVSVDDDV